VATNIHGSSKKFSPTTREIGEFASIAGLRVLTLDSVVAEGDTVTAAFASRGTPAPIATFQWLRCDTAVGDRITRDVVPPDCVPITNTPKTPSRTGSYTATALDVKKFLTVRVTLTNKHNAVTDISNSTPEIYSAPQISGKLAVSGRLWAGETVEATGAVVKGHGTPSETWKWYRNGVLLSGQNQKTYTLVDADSGQRISYELSASNPAGTDSEVSSAVFIKGPPTPLNPLFAIVGMDNDEEALVGSTLRANTSPSAWRAVPALTPANLSYQWYVCSNSDPELVVRTEGQIPQDCQPIAKQTKSTYKVEAKYETKFVGYSVTAKNGTVNKTWFSKKSARVYVLPKYLSG
jgi:hypothetical protein